MSNPRAYYNDNDQKVCAWLRELIKRGLIADGDVDDRSICDVKADDVRGYNQCHFFAGISGWALAVQLAGLQDEEGVWSASCPCQPWSIGNTWQGGGRGYDDRRHLFPELFRLVEQCRPRKLFGEQVPGAVKKGWLDTVFDSLEGIGYSCRATVFPTRIIGTKHERKRLWWCAYTSGSGWKGHKPLKSILEPATTPLPVDGNPLARAWSALDGNIDGLLHCNGLSVQLERDAVKAFGNSIVPEAAAEFIQACEEVMEVSK